MKFGFVYIWKDMKRNKFYIGSHMGSFDDGYIGSNKRLKTAYKARPWSFRRKIIESNIFEKHAELLTREEYWLQQIKPEELKLKYYNEKCLASGGDIYSTLSESDKVKFKEKSLKPRLEGHHRWRAANPKLVSEHARLRRSKVKNPSGGSMPGELNPFYGKTHTRAARDKMIRGAVGKLAYRTKKYVLIFPDGTEEIFTGLSSISNKYCSETKIAFYKFIDTGLPINSNRKHNSNNQLRGCIIREHGYAYL
jgi:hypothetical protein